MIVLDTNVISELMRSEPHTAVIAWAAEQSRGSLYTASVNEAELFYGIRNPDRDRSNIESSKMGTAGR